MGSGSACQWQCPSRSELADCRRGVERDARLAREHSRSARRLGRGVAGKPKHTCRLLRGRRHIRVQLWCNVPRRAPNAHAGEEQRQLRRAHARQLGGLLACQAVLRGHRQSVSAACGRSAWAPARQATKDAPRSCARRASSAQKTPSAASARLAKLSHTCAAASCAGALGCASATASRAMRDLRCVTAGAGTTVQSSMPTRHTRSGMEV